MNEPPANESFATTNWSVVVAAGARGLPKAADALAALCQAYWYPLFAFARRQGCVSALAEDLTQGFFESLLERDFLRSVDRTHGRFRSFLLASFKHYIANQQRAARTQKRGGDRRLFSIDAHAADARYQSEPWHEETPERQFERQWALTVLDNVLASLKHELVSVGKADRFDALKDFLSGADASQGYACVASRLGMSQGAVKVAVHRLRQRLGHLLRLEIARTVTNALEIEDEVRQLFEAFRVC